MAPKPYWDKYKLALIREHAPFMSAGQMVALYFPGVSRSAVMGVAHRHNITFRKAGQPPRIRKRKPKPAKPVRAKPAPELSVDQTHMRGSSAPMLVRPPVQKPLPPADPPSDNNLRPPRTLAFEDASPAGSWTLWNIGHGQCRFPIGHNGMLTLFCGEVIAFEGCPYCSHHRWRTMDRGAQRRATGGSGFTLIRK